jgi:arginine decarboxylase
MNIEDGLVPRKIFFTKGVGRANTHLSAFESALRSAGIAKLNLVKVSSIIPPNCEIISKEEGFNYLKPGAITFLVLSRIDSDEPNRLMAASVGLAIPKDKDNYGYLSEYEAFGETDEIAGEKAEDLAASMLASTLGIDFDVNQAWDEKEKTFRMSNKIVKTSHVTQSAVVSRDTKVTCVVSAGVFIF